jgi:hypothetical protein
VLPDGYEYEIVSRQNVAFAAACRGEHGKILGALTINQPSSSGRTRAS